MRFKDQVVMVTGSSQGIGKEIAQGFAEEGAIVAIIDVNAEQAEETKNEFIAKGLKAESFACDVTNLQNVGEIVTKILDKYKRIDILVNNAGITKDNLLLRMNENDWDAVINVNLRGPFICTKSVTKAMMKARQGRIINIASIIGIRGNAGQANYAATKAGVIGFTKSIARELASRGVTVNAIAPGYIQTAMTAKLSEKVQDDLLKMIPLGTLGTAKDVAGACLFLASKEASYITGQTIVVDGGMAI
jgi:3-oxoacyl-[acyl-carrier protein] reductase